MIDLPLTAAQCLDLIVNPALLIFPPMLTSDEARIQMLADGLQETRLATRVQLHHGPAHGLWQNELESIECLLDNHATKDFMIALCKDRSVRCQANAIYDAVLRDDLLDAGCHRLLMWADPHKLPRIGDSVSAWRTYLDVQRPGVPRPLTWPWCYKTAMNAVLDDRE